MTDDKTTTSAISTGTVANKDVKNAQKNPQLSTQRYLEFSEVHDDTLILKNGGLRAVLEVSSINFNLKSDEEQESIIRSYQGFLNSLNFPVQILIRSRKLDIDHYLDDLRRREREIENNLLRDQMGHYIEYIQKLVENADIMEKKFYVVVPANPMRAEKKSAFGSFLEMITPDDSVEKIMQRKREFKDIKKELDSRVGTVKTSLENCGLNVTQLKTEKIIELFYQAYNPGLARTQKFKSLEEMSVSPGPSGNLIPDDKQ